MYNHEVKHRKAETEKCAKKHIRGFPEAKSLGVQQSTTKDAQAAENAQTTAHSAYTNPKKKRAKRGQS